MEILVLYGLKRMSRTQGNTAHTRELTCTRTIATLMLASLLLGFIKCLNISANTRSNASNLDLRVF